MANNAGDLKESGRPVRNPVQSRSVKKKDWIIEAAYRLFNKTDYQKVSVRMIAREAGVSIGTIYSYFKDKQDIFVAARTLYRDEMHRRFLEAIETKLDPSDPLEHAIMTLLKTFEDIIGRFAVFHRQNLILSLSDKKLGADQMALEWNNTRALAEIFYNKFGHRITVEDTETVTYILHRILKEMVETLLFFPMEVSKDNVFKELSTMLAGYLSGRREPGNH